MWRSPMPTTSGRFTPAAARSRWWLFLLLIPFVGLLWVPFYNRIDPVLFSIPFFYWYQFIWVFLILPRMWAVAHRHNYVTGADFVHGRYGNRWLALAVAVTGIVATMPYIALQLLGLQVVIGAMGVGTGGGLAGDIPLIIAFVILAAFTYTSGLRAPAVIALVKDTLIYITVLALAIVVPYPVP